MRVLVITSEPDPHVDMVRRKIPETEFSIFDPSKIPFSSNLTYLFRDGGTYEIRFNDRVLNGVEVVWFRKPVIIEPNKLPVGEQYRKYTHTAYKNAAQAIFALLRNSYWVSDPWAILRANNKLVQQEIAFSRGLRIPKTLVTNSADDVRKFLNEQGSIVAKPLGAEVVNESGVAKAFYSTKIIADDDVDLSGLQVAPAIFQEDLSGCLDIRVTVVGNNVYACEIRKTGDLHSKVDWRVGVLTMNLTYLPHNLPCDLSATCISVIQDLGIKFGCFDFMLDTKGRYWFLEVNPNGQWGFIEENSGLLISDGFVELFTQRSFA